MPKEILISQFKARCIAELKRVQQTGQPLIVTRRGTPIARVEAVRAASGPAVRLGSRRGHATSRRDLVRFDFTDEWEMNR
jgi:prevent-host-death family protein